MDYLALDDRRLSRQGTFIHFHNLLFIDKRLSGSTKDSSSSETVQEEEDFILSSLEAYPKNDTEDSNLQLTESELLGTHNFYTTISALCYLTGTISRNWL